MPKKYQNPKKKNLYLYISSCATLNETLTAKNIATFLHFPQNTLSET